MNILRSIAQKLLFWRRRAPIDGSATARRVLSFDGMTILIVQTTDTQSRTKIMQSKDGFDFQPSSQAISYDLDQLPCAAIAPDPRHAGHKLMYFGDRTVKLATSTDGHHWHPVEQDLGLHTR